MLLQITADLSNYYKLQQLLVLLQITATHYHKLQQVLQFTTLLQVITGIIQESDFCLNI